MNVFIVGGDDTMTEMWREQGHDVVYDITHDVDIVQFTGGSDVSPSLYGEAKHPRSHISKTRDRFEKLVFEDCVERGIPMVGICRGGQFLNVMCGGRMYQDVDGHATGQEHLMVDLMSGELVPVTSTHHQMMRPSEEGAVLAVASEAHFGEYMEGEAVKVVPLDRGQDVEAVFYKKQKVLCYQPHPEYRGTDHPCQQLYFEYIKEMITCAD